LRRRRWFDILDALTHSIGATGGSLETPGPGRGTWAAAVEARAFGVRFGVRVTDPSLLPLLLEHLPPGSRVCDTTRRGGLLYSIVSSPAGAVPDANPPWQLHVDDSLEAEVAGQPELLDAFERQVRFDVARLAARWTFVHAGVVEWKGRAILIPGLSYSGKSRLVEALVRAGAVYYSDEYAALGPKGLVYPFAKPLTLRRDDGSVVHVEARDLGHLRGHRPLQVGVVVSTRYVHGARWNPTVKSAGSVVLALLAHSIRAQIAPQRVLQTLAKVADTAIMFDGDRGEADQTAADLLDRIPS
jgi:hypothetical protein